MTQTVGDFQHSTECEPHHPRTKAILLDHPEVRELIGRNPWSFAIILGIIAAQFSVAWTLRDSPWWLIGIVAYCFGAFVNHTSYVMVHDATHGLIFRTRWANNLAAILAGAVNAMPTAMSFRSYHLIHHSHQGVHDVDADIPSYWEARLVGSSFFRKLIWLLLFPVVQSLRPLRLKQLTFLTRWTLADWAIVFSIDALVIWAWGPRAFLYLLVSLFFAVGLHPLGARWIQEHYMVGPDSQETFSYYGRLNWLACNVGYHTEHHDFTSVPWNRLPQVTAVAPEYYASLVSHDSWTRLIWRFLTEADLSLWARTVREGRHGDASDCPG